MSYKFLIEPTKEQENILKNILKYCHFIYNYMLEEKIYMHKVHGISMSCEELQGILPVLKNIYPELKLVPSQAMQEVVKRVHNAFLQFFNLNGGFPKFKSKYYYNSFIYTQLSQNRNFKDNNYIYLPKLGNIKYMKHREFDIAHAKTATIKKENNKWYISIVVEESDMEKVKLEDIGKDTIIGIDLGVKVLATLSNGTIYKNNKNLKKSEVKVKKASKALSKKKRGSRNRNKAKRKVKSIHTKITNQRNDDIHKLTKEIVTNFNVIIIEDLNITRMLKSKDSNLNKSINDASMGNIIKKLEYKCEKYGKILIKVDPRNTSKDCSNCGNIVEKTLKDRIHKCSICGIELDRDLNASINILKLGLKTLKIA